MSKHDIEERPKTPEELMAELYFADGGDARFRFEYTLTPDSIVLDLGGYKGQWASDIYAMYLCNIIIFEPVKNFARAIRKRFRRNPKIQVRNDGVGGYTRTEVISVCKDASSTFKRFEDCGLEHINIVDMAEVVNAYPTIDLIKINIEGGEYEVLERLITIGAISKVHDIQVQFHNMLPESEGRMYSIQSKLNETHYLTYQYKFVWENWSRRGE